MISYFRALALRRASLSLTLAFLTASAAQAQPPSITVDRSAGGVRRRSSSISIGGSKFDRIENSGNAAVFSGASDEQVKQYFLQLTGASELPEPLPIRINGFEGARYTLASPFGNFTLRDVSRSQSETGPCWTIDIPEDALGTKAGREIKFLRTEAR